MELPSWKCYHETVSLLSAINGAKSIGATSGFFKILNSKVDLYLF